MNAGMKILGVIIAALAIGAFAPTASAVTAYEFEPVAACRMVGCPGGDQLCAEVTGTVAVGSVKWFCYKPTPGKPTSGKKLK
jgi:hypothetical protein